MFRDADGKRFLFQPEYAHPKMPSLFSLTRSALLLAGLLALCDSAAAQLRPPYNDASDSTAATATAPDQATEPPSQVAPADNSIDTLRKKAEAGDASAQGLLGVAYYKGEGVERDVVEAVNWFHKSADQGNSDAQFAIGVCYADGDGIEKDAVEAVQWYRKAADQANAMAQVNLGGCYANGKGVDEDIVEAAKWYRKAADHGNAEAQFRLGLCYQYGKGVEIDVAEGDKWYCKAADQGNAGAQCLLGNAYYNGIGVEKDEAEAVKWYRKSAEKGDALAQYLLGECYHSGEGVEKDDAEGLAWLYVSSASGNEKAANYISIQQNYYNDAIISAAHQRATELQVQIASHTFPEQDASATAILPTAPAANAPKTSGSSDYVPTFGNRTFSPEDSYQAMSNLRADTSAVMAAAFELQRNQLSLTSYDHRHDLGDLEIIHNSSGSTGQQIAIILARIGGALAAPITWICLIFICLIAWIVTLTSRKDSLKNLKQSELLRADDKRTAEENPGYNQHEKRGVINVCICRDGVEIGTWSEDAVKRFYAEGSLVDADLYWTEGMSEWLTLESLVKPPPPFPAEKMERTDSSSPALELVPPLESEKDQSTLPVSVPKKYPGLNRIEFSVGFISTFTLGFFIGIQIAKETSNADDGQLWVLKLFFTSVLLYLLAKRLQNVGYPRWTCLFGLIPFVGFILFLFCLFAPPGYRLPQEAQHGEPAK